MTNDELRAALQAKLPKVELTERDLTMFALGTEVGAAAKVGAPEPRAWMWQHDETGMTGFVEHASPEELQHWERMNKPRTIVCPLYSSDPDERWLIAIEEAEASLSKGMVAGAHDILQRALWEAGNDHHR